MFIPFIGITDFMDRRQVEAMRKVFLEAGGASTGRRLGVGVMTSRKVVHGLPSDWAAVFPKVGDIAGIFVRKPDVFNVLHYADYRSVDLAQSLNLATEYGGSNMEAIQLDMTWPDVSIVRAYRASHPNIQVVLQVGKDAMEAVGNKPSAVLNRLEGYVEGIDAVLLDKSMGTGLGMNATELLAYMHAIRERFPMLHLVAAGGLGPNSMHLAAPIIKSFPDVSLDAQGKLRPSGNARDPIDWKYAAAYLQRAIALLQS